MSSASASLAVTGVPMSRFAAVFSATLRPVVVPSVNVGAVLSGCVVVVSSVGVGSVLGGCLVVPSLSTIVNVATAGVPSVAFTGLLSVTVNVSSLSTSASFTRVTVKHARCCWGWSATVPLCEP